MNTTAWRFAHVSCLLLGSASIGLPAETRQAQTWQADIQIRTLEVTRSRTGMSVRVIVYTENDDEARDARLLILLPVAVGVERLGDGCAATAGPSMVPSLRATVACDLGPIANQGFREVLLSTTLPPDGKPKRFGVFAYSATPDPMPGNNYAERTLP
jgi:hypothetical protein